MKIAVSRIDLKMIGDVVAVVAAGGWKERQQPDADHARLRQVVQPGGQAGEIT